MGPQLKANLCGKLRDFETEIISKRSVVEHWFRDMFAKYKPPFYSSVDLRNACFKIAPIDTNLFPAGFNNIGEDDRRSTVQAFMSAVERHCPHAETVLIIPENHTRNLYYHQHIGHLHTLLSNVGLKAIIGSHEDSFCNLKEIVFKNLEGLPTSVPINKVYLKKNVLYVDGRKPDLVLFNNDFSSGIPGEYRNLSDDQIFVPSLDASWAIRKKSSHFKLYEETATEFTNIFDFDSWFINPINRRCSNINFREKKGEECLVKNVEEVLNEIKKKYTAYGIKKKPFVVIKANSGTYGMSVMTIRESSEIYRLNNKQRKKMSTNKEGIIVKDVLIQEGVYSFETVVNYNVESVAEPVVYLVDKYVVGGFYRIHSEKGLDENLNTPGMKFFPLAFEDSCQLPASSNDPDSITNRLYFYGVIARLATLAAAKEMQK